MLEKAKYLHLSSAQVLKQFKRAGRHEKRTKKAQNGKYETVWDAKYIAVYECAEYVRVCVCVWGVIWVHIRQAVEYLLLT